MFDKFGVVDEISVQLIRNPTKTRKIIAVGGQPGTGKTTLFRKFMENKQWIEEKTTTTNNIYEIIAT
jgi:GTPase SAR1 family protein